MFAFFERQLKPTQAPERPEPPASLLAFYWHYAREARRLFIALFAAGFVVALLDTMIPVFIGRVVTLLTSNPPDQLFEEFWPLLLLMAPIIKVPPQKRANPPMTTARTTLPKDQKEPESSEVWGVGCADMTR